MATLGRENIADQDMTPSNPTHCFVGQALLDALDSDPLPLLIPHDGSVQLPQKASSEVRESSSSSPVPADVPRSKVLQPWRQDSLKRVLIWRQWQLSHPIRDQSPGANLQTDTSARFSNANDFQRAGRSKTTTLNLPFTGQKIAVANKGKKARSNQRKRDAKQARETQESQAHLGMAVPLNQETLEPKFEVGPSADKMTLTQAVPPRGELADAHALFESTQRRWYGGSDGTYHSHQNGGNNKDWRQESQLSRNQSYQLMKSQFSGLSQHPLAKPWIQNQNQKGQQNQQPLQHHAYQHPHLQQIKQKQHLDRSVLQSGKLNSAQILAQPNSASPGVRRANPQQLQDLRALRKPNVRNSLTLPIPEPSMEYLKRCQLQAFQLQTPQPLLLVIDLNGTLLCRTNHKASFKPRVNVEGFLKHLLKNHYVMVWSSSRPDNVSNMVSQLFDAEGRSQLLAEWARDTLGLSERQYYQKVQVYKQLHWLWNSPLASLHPQTALGVKWNQSNTILLDDSIKKAAAEPHNIVLIPEFTGKPESEDVLGQVLAYIERARWFSDVSAVMRSTPFSVGQEAPWDWN